MFVNHGRIGEFGWYALLAAVTLLVALPTSGVLLSAPKVDLAPAEQALASGRFQEAVDILTPVIAADSKNGEAHLLLGDAYTGLFQWPQAQTAYQAAVDARVKDIRATVGLANCLIALGKPAEVSLLLTKPLEKLKDVKEAALVKNALGRAEIALGNYSKAQEWLLGARYDDESNIKHRLDLGDAYFLGQIYPLAATEYEAVLANDSTKLDVMYKLGETYYNQRRLTEARGIYTDLLGRDSTYHEAYFRLANIYMIAAQSRSLAEGADLYKAALALYRKVRAVDPQADPVLVSKNIATVYYLLNAHDSAAVELQNALDAGATDPELYFYMGRSNMLLGQYDKAIVSFQRYRQNLEQASPPHEWKKEDAEVFWRLANCLEALNDSTQMTQIIDNYQRAVQLDATDERSIAGLALAYHKVGRYAEAAVEFEKLVVAHPNESRHLFNASLPYMQLENNEKAVEYLLRAAQNDTTGDQAYRERAYKLAAPRLIKMQRIADAQTAYKWLVEKEPDVCDHYQWYGYTYFASRNYAAALPHLKRAYRCFEQLASGNCKHNELRWWLAYAQYEGGEKEAAYELCEKVVECTPDNRDARDLMNRIDEEIIEEN